MIAETPRIPLLPQAEWTDAVRDVFSIFEGEEGRAKGSKFNVILMLAHHPELARAWLEYNKSLLGSSGLAARLKEIVILRVAWRYQSEYEWAQHVQIGRRVGLESEHIEAIKGSPDAPIWSGLERHALRAVDQLTQHAQIDNETWSALACEFDHREMLELLFTIGTYAMLSWIFNATGLQLEAGMSSASPMKSAARVAVD